MLRNPSIVLVLFSALIVTGCAGISGYPARSTNVESELQALSTYNDSLQVIKIYNGLSGKAREEYRNEVVNARLAT